MLCVVVQTVIFGFGNVITKFAYESVTPLWCMVLRFGLALAVFALGTVNSFAQIQPAVSMTAP